MRFLVPVGSVELNDCFAGRQQFDVARELARAMPDVADKVRLGWELVLEKLETQCAK